MNREEADMRSTTNGAIRVAAGVIAVALFVVGSSVAWSPSVQAAAEALPVQTAAEALLARSIAFHDAQGRWGSRTVQLAWNGTGAEGEERSVFDISILPDGRSFEMSGRYRGSGLEYATDGMTYTASVDGSTEMSDETLSRMRLGRDGGMFWRDYFSFLAGLPMKLRDPGTLIDADPVATEFMGRQVESIRVTYTPEVGGDTWYFYFDPESAQLIGCRFYHDESVNDGEYIVFDGLIEADGLRLPQSRRWYVNADDRFLGEDVIERLALSSGTP